MESKETFLQLIKNYHETGQTIKAALLLIDKFELNQPNFGGILLREKADPSYILFTAEGKIGEPIFIRIPENTFEFPLELMVNLLAHEMVHVIQKSKALSIEIREEREWQAYYEMCFHKIFPKVPNASKKHRLFFANKALEYYNRMPKGGVLQQKYSNQKLEIEQFIEMLSV
ncbi:hypothetical protein [Flavobacterium sp.]|jgi:hypothetical protein|uniref:hypothetical protein n=3 Tax=Flavobacterium sp. TaxID=239 RepID=UPI0037C1A260